MQFQVRVEDPSPLLSHKDKGDPMKKRSVCSEGLTSSPAPPQPRRPTQGRAQPRRPRQAGGATQGWAQPRRPIMPRRPGRWSHPRPGPTPPVESRRTAARSGRNLDIKTAPLVGDPTRPPSHHFPSLPSRVLPATFPPATAADEMDGGRSRQSLYRRPPTWPKPKGIYSRPKEPDGGLFIEIDHKGNPRIVYPTSSTPCDQDGRHSHERAFNARSTLPGDLSNKPPLCLATPGNTFFSRKPVATEASFYSGVFEGMHDKVKGPLKSLSEQFNSYMDKWDDAKGVHNNFSQGPGLFRHIGRDAKAVLFFDFNSDILRLEPINKSNLVCGAGVTSAQNFPLRKLSLRKLFFSLKHVNTAFDLNGTLNDNLLAKISFDGVLGANTRGVLYLPLPSFKSKFEFQAFHRFAGLTAGFGTGIRPCPEVSCLLDVKLFCFGGSLKYDPTISEWSSSGGVSVQLPNASIGLTVNQDRIATATVHRSYPKWRTSFGILASVDLDGPFYPLVPYFGGPIYCPVPRRVPRHHAPRRVEEENDPVPRRIEDSAVIVGVSHQLNDEILLKARVSSDCVASVLVKMTFWGAFSVAASADVDYFDLNRMPSAGLVVSVH